MLPKSKLLHYALIVLTVAMWIAAFLSAHRAELEGFGVSGTVLAFVTSSEVVLEGIVAKFRGAGVVILLVAGAMIGGAMFSACGPVRDCMKDPTPSRACLAGQDAIKCTSKLFVPAAEDALSFLNGGHTFGETAAKFGYLGLDDLLCVFETAVSQAEAGKFASSTTQPARVSPVVLRAAFTEWRASIGVNPKRAIVVELGQ